MITDDIKDRIVDVEQGSDEWRLARAGKIGGSDVADATAKLKSGEYGAGRKNLVARLVVERLTGRPSETFQNDAMRRGTEMEPIARANYEIANACEVATVGIVKHPRVEGGQCSPDGLVGTDGLVQIKCPNSATHIDTLITESIDGGYLKQMQWEMACTGRKWCDFVSFDDRLPDHMALWRKRVMRDDEMIAELETEVARALAYVTATVAKLHAKFGRDA